MRRLGTTLIIGVAVSLFFIVPAAASSDNAGRPSSPPPSHPVAPSQPEAPSIPPAASHTTPPSPSHPAAPSTGSAVSSAAKGLGQEVRVAAKAGDSGAIHTAVDEHKTAVTTAANGGAAGTSAGSHPDANGGNSANAKGHGAQVAALAHATGGAKGGTVSAFARTLSELVRDGALSLGEHGQQVSSIDDPDTALDSGLLPDDGSDSNAGNTPLPDVAFNVLTA